VRVCSPLTSALCVCSSYGADRRHFGWDQGRLSGEHLTILQCVVQIAHREHALCDALAECLPYVTLRGHKHIHRLEHALYSAHLQAATWSYAESGGEPVMPP
jgi:hypothetical protein